MKQPFFELHDAEVVRQGKIILYVDDLVIKKGDHIAILGPNGAGKSTFIQLLTREVIPLYRDLPPVKFKGSDYPQLSAIHSSVAVVSATMHEQVRVHLKVKEIVAGGYFPTLGLPMRREIPNEIWDKVYSALKRLHIDKLAERDMMTLSTGQARRVLVARELMHRPEILIFDEPTTGLDPQGMYELRQTMEELAHIGKTIILVTQYPEDIIPSVKRVILIKDARIIGTGPKQEMLSSLKMRELFEVPLRISVHNGWYTLHAHPVQELDYQEYDVVQDEAFMREALQEAKIAELENEVPIGAVVVHEGKIIARAHNTREGHTDPAGHAEFLAMREAAEVLNRWRLSGCTLYVTLEPCTMCAGMIINSRIDRVVFAAKDPKAGAVGSLYNVLEDTRLNHRVTVSTGVLETEAKMQLQDFFSKKRR